MDPSDKRDFTRLLQLAQQGDLDAEHRLFETIEQELRQIAARVARGG